MSNEYKDYQRALLVDLTTKMREVGDLYDGWRKTFVPDMIYELYEVLGSYVEDFEVYQIKEKFGSLTIYWGWKYRDCTDEEIADHNKLEDAVNDVIAKYKKISERTCVQCGGKAISK
jgi:hypothetical protein